MGTIKDAILTAATTTPVAIPMDTAVVAMVVVLMATVVVEVMLTVTREAAAVVVDTEEGDMAVDKVVVTACLTLVPVYRSKTGT
jgi:hypothetical protein